MRRSILGLVFTVCAASFVLAQAPTPAAGGTTFYPLKKGSKWTYKLNDLDVVVQVGDTDKAGETKLETLSNGKVVANESVKVDATGVYRTKINGTAITPPVKILELKDGKPAAKGAKWTVDSTIQQQKVAGDFEIKDDKAALKVPVGELKDVIAVEGGKLTVAGTETAVKYWFADGKGIVKLSYTINGQDAILELKSYEEGK